MTHENRPMKILVTGAAGFIGRKLVPALTVAGHTPRVLVRSLQEGTQDARQAIRMLFDSELVLPVSEFVTGNLPDKALCERLCAGMEAVIHAAGVAHVAADQETLRTNNLDATLQLAQIAKQQGVRKFVFLSSSKARYPAHSAYARLKAEAERGLHKLHQPGVFEVVCLRPALVYGQGMRGNLRNLLRVLTQPWLPVFIASKQKIGMISVHDLCRALVIVLATEGLPDQIWEVADGQQYTLSGLVRHVRGTLGLPLPRASLPPALSWTVAAAAGLLAPLFRSPLSLGTWRALYAEDYWFDLEFSRRTGFTPQDLFYTRLPELLEDTTL